MTETTVPDGTDVPSGPGAMLRAARERQNLSAAEVARQLRLATRQIEALEADDFAALPGPIFVRGFIRTYAKLAQIDAEPVLEALRRVMPEQPAGSPQPQPLGTPLPAEGGSGSRRRAVMALLLLVLLPLALYEVFRQSQQGSQPGVAQPVAPLAVPAAPAEPPVAPAPSAAPEAAAPAEPPAGQPSASSHEAPAAAPAPAEPAALAVVPPVAPVPTAEPVQASPGPGDATLRFSFSGESWVEVRDREGRRVFSQTSPAGTEQTIYAAPPVSLVVGNASEVRLVYDGQPVDLAPHTRVNVARLTLE